MAALMLGSAVPAAASMAVYVRLQAGWAVWRRLTAIRCEGGAVAIRASGIRDAQGQIVALDRGFRYF